LTGSCKDGSRSTTYFFGACFAPAGGNTRPWWGLCVQERAGVCLNRNL
jgi:hypothetical protein